MVPLETTDTEERPVTTMWCTRSRFVTILSVAGCLLTPLAIVTTVSVYLTLENEDQGECLFAFVQSVIGGCEQPKNPERSDASNLSITHW